MKQKLEERKTQLSNENIELQRVIANMQNEIIGAQTALNVNVGQLKEIEILLKELDDGGDK